MANNLKALRLRAELSQDELAERMGTTRNQLTKLEAGSRRLSDVWIERASKALQVDAGELVTDLKIVQLITPTPALEPVAEAPPALASGYREPPQFLGARDLKVFASAECGDGEMQVFSNEPYEVIPRAWYVERDPDAYGVLLTGESMEPLYEAGQIAIVSPRAPLVKGKQALFCAEPSGGDFRASMKRYRGQTAEQWLVKQFNPEKEFEFERGIWRKADRVLGVFDG